MTEQENANQGNRSWHPLMRLMIENPVSALNAAMILFGGGAVYAQIGSYMRENDQRVARIEQQIRESNIAANIKNDRATMRIDGISQKIGKVEVSVGRIESSLEFLVRQARQNERRQ
jgi:hypothetical protein